MTAHDLPKPADVSPASVGDTFTPGPWQTNVKRLSDASICVAHVVAGEDRKSVAQLATHGEDETVANLFLIASAPELYAALESIAKKADDLVADPYTSNRGLWKGCADEAREALAKAQGKSA